VLVRDRPERIDWVSAAVSTPVAVREEGLKGATGSTMAGRGGTTTAFGTTAGGLGMAVLAGSGAW